jgi:acyl-CoA synthetase (AMP-forming)/AMP-acid ligase II
MPQPLIAQFMETYNVEVRHGWGMTETTAVATMGTLPTASRDWAPPQRHALLAKQGKSVFGIDIKVVDESGATLSRDGTSQGELMVRGQWIVSSCYKGDRSPLVDGWFPTGDIAAIDAAGVMQIRDGTKDVIKTGSEWISSLDLESAAIAHPAVAMAAVIGVKHPKWDERPLLFLVLKPGQAVKKDEILAFLGERAPKWWVPDDVVFLDALPVGGTGKVQKGDLRKQYGGVFS